MVADGLFQLPSNDVITKEKNHKHMIANMMNEFKSFGWLMSLKVSPHLTEPS